MGRFDASDEAFAVKWEVGDWVQPRTYVVVPFGPPMHGREQQWDRALSDAFHSAYDELQTRGITPFQVFAPSAHVAAVLRGWFARSTSDFHGKAYIDPAALKGTYRGVSLPPIVGHPIGFERLAALGDRDLWTTGRAWILAGKAEKVVLAEASIDRVTTLALNELTKK